MSVKYSLPEVAMYAFSYDTSGLFLPHSNTLETLKLGTSYVISFPSSFCSVIVYYDLSISVEHSLSTSTEQVCNKSFLAILCFDSSLLAEKF